MEQASLSRVLLQGFNLAAGAEKRTLPNLAVDRHDRLHFHISNGTGAIPNVKVRILFGTRVGSKTLLSDSTVWFETGVNETNFEFTTPANFGGTGFILSVPVVTPLLFDVIVQNRGTSALNDLHVTVFAQEI